MLRPLIVLALCLGLTACPGSAMNAATKRLAEGLSSGLLSQDDLEIVSKALPSYLITIDGLIASSPEVPELAVGGGRLYSFYASYFVEDEARKKSFMERAYRYARHGLCLEFDDLCEVFGKPLEEFREELLDLDEDDIAILYPFATTWASWLQMNSDDWNAIADVPRLEMIMEHIARLDPFHDHGNVHIYLGVLTSQIPPAMGGKPEKARTHFERAVDLSEDKNLMAKVMFAKQYARLIFDQKLHDSLLREVLAADPHYGDLTLSNVLAQREAEQLLAESPEFF